MFTELYASLFNLFFSVQAIHQKSTMIYTPLPFGEWILLSLTTLFYLLKKIDLTTHTFTMWHRLCRNLHTPFQSFLSLHNQVLVVGPYGHLHSNSRRQSWGLKK